jgi:type IV secretion system protein VirD4
MLTSAGDFATPEEEKEFDDGDSKGLSALFQEMQSVALDDLGEAAREAQIVIRGVGYRMENTPSRELGSIISTANTELALYRDPIVGENTSRSDFKIADLMDHDKPVSLYFITNPRDLVRMRPLARLLLTQIVSGLTDSMQFSDGRSTTKHKHDLLLMLDEFPSLGKLEMFESALAFIRGYGIKAYIITQDVQQLYKAYTNYESIISNCDVRIAYAPNKLETAEWLSKMTGQTTVIKEQISTSGKRFGGGSDSYSRSYQETQRPLLTANETTQLNKMHITADSEEPGEMLVFKAGSPVIFARQTPYFLDETFNARSKIPPPAKSDIVRHKEEVSK